MKPARILLGALAAAAASVVGCGGAAPGGGPPAVARLIPGPPRETLRSGTLGTAAGALDGALGAGGWLPMGHAGSWRIEHEELIIESGGAAFDLERTIDLPASGLHALEVVLRSGYKVGLSLSWQREGEDGWVERGLELDYNAGTGDQHRKTFTFDLPSHDAWSGTITRLRLRFEPARDDERIVIRRLQGWRQAMSPDALAAISRRAWRVELDREVRDALVVPPGHPVEREVRVPEHGLLDFGLGATGRLSAPVTLRVSVVRPSGTPVLYEGRLEPVAYAAARRWQRVTLDLGAFGGETLRLRFESLADPGFDPALGFPACAHPEIVPSKVEATRPNVILISVDTLRADRLSLYGYGRRTSPRIDAWARRFAVVFSGAVVQAPWTLPSHTSMLTGLDALRHGVNHSFRAAPEELSTLAESFYAAGYTTAGITGGGWLHPHYGLAQGYERFRYWIGERRGDEELEAHAPTAASWLDELREPFFLFLHTYDVHDFNAPDRAKPPASGDPLADLGRGYDRAVTHMDGLLGRFLERFESRGLRGRTVLALTSDHGEDLGEDGVYGHGSLRDQVLLVPLVMELPGGQGAGRVIAEQVRSVDVVPTLLDLAGIEAPPGLDGVSLRGLVAGEPAVPPAAVASAYFSLRHGVALRFRNRWKYVYDFSAWAAGGREALYRLPGGESPERDDVAAGHPQTARFRTMARRLIDERLAGLVLGFENSLPTPFSGTLRGDLVGADVPKSTDLSGPWLTRLDDRAARFSLPPGERFHLLFERLGEPRFVLETPAADGLPRESRRLTVDLDELTLPASYRWTGTRWQAAAETALRDAGAGVTIEWRRTAGAAEGAAPFQQDPELRRQLEALGYLD